MIPPSDFKAMSKGGGFNMKNEKERDLFANKPIWYAILSLAVPSVLGQLILVLYNLADTFFVGLANNNAMLTAVTVVMPAYMFLSAIANLFGVGAASLISRSIGAGIPEKAKHAFAFSIYGSLAVGAVYCLLCLFFADGFIDLLGGTDPEVHANAVKYLYICIVFCGVPTVLNNTLAHLLRSHGMSFHASLGVVLGGILNVAFDPLFMFVIFGKENVVLGAGLATGLSNVIALLYYAVLLIIKRKKILFTLVPSKAMFQRHIPVDILLVGLPACLMTLCENISYAILDKMMSSFGLSAQTGIGAAKKVNMVAHSVVRGMAQGVLPLIGYNATSGDHHRMKKAVYLSTGISATIAIVCFLVNFIFPTALLRIFLNDPTNPALPYGTKFLRILSVGAPFSAVAYSIISFFQAVGKGGRSLLLALLRKGILDIPVMFVLFFCGLPGEISMFGIVGATPIADFVCFLIALILFFSFLKQHAAMFDDKTLEDN